MDDKRLIEVDFPLKEVSEESAKEKNIRNHIATLHVWWARRPLAVSRATAFAALVPAPSNNDELQGMLEFTSKLSKWKNSPNENLLQSARKAIRDYFEGKMPRVLDCFAGGGAIPLESLRLGCDTYALELNPVAIIILKAVIEYPQKFAGERNKTEVTLRNSSASPYRLVEDIEKWGEWVLKEARKEIEKLYPKEPDGKVPVGYVWARTIKCKNPSCKAEIPLMRHLWLVKKENSKIALKIKVDKLNKIVSFKIVKGGEIDFDPSQGITQGATVLCPICGAGIDENTMRREASEGKTGQRLVAVIFHHPKETGKTYRLATENDVKVFHEASKYLVRKIENWRWDFNPIPDEDLPPVGTLGFRVQRYGMLKWGDLFNSRQKLALITFLEKIRLACEKMLSEGYSSDYAIALTTYLAIGLDKLANRASSLAYWYTLGEKIQPTFVRQTLSMVWDYVEVNPFSGSTGDWRSAVLVDLANIVSQCSSVSNSYAHITQGTATKLPFSDGFFDAVFTDPPYYDNVPYADLSDFFYVWLKRTIGDLYPDLFSTPLTPKSQEIVQNPVRQNNDPEKAKEFFEDMLTQAFKEIYRVLSNHGIAVIVFAHKSTEAWETVVSSLLRSGLVLTASWPVHTEMKGRLRAQESAALASSIYMVCRKRGKEEVAYFNEIKNEIDKRIRDKLTQFWEQGISGADFFVSAIGPAVEVFGKHSKVEKLSGEEVSVQELLEYVRKIVSEFALERVLKRADLGGVDAETRFYLLWRWTFGNAKVHFDEAIKLSRPMGVELTGLWDTGGLVQKDKEFIRVLDPKERAKDPAFLKKAKFTSMVDALHHVVILWEAGEREKIKDLLNETGYAGSEIFWQTAQAISEILPQGDKEKQLLQGLLYGKEIYVKGARGKANLTDYMERG